MPVLLAALALLALALSGCGEDSVGGSGEVDLLVTDGFGRTEVARGPVEAKGGGEDPLDFLRRALPDDVTTSGEAITAIAGKRGRWSLFINGVAPVDDRVEVHGGDRVWVDRRAADDVEAVVGAFPDPFLHGTGGERLPMRLQCADDADAACDRVADVLSGAGAVPARAAIGTDTGDFTLRVLVGRWAEVRANEATQQLEKGPRESGVYARPTRDGRSIALLDARGRVARTLRAGGGLVAATRYEKQAATWVVTGTDAAGVDAAVQAFEEATLANRYAVAVAGGRSLAVPVTAPAKPVY